MKKSKSNKATFPFMHMLGGHYIKLGKAMRKRDTTMEKLTHLADKCGLQLQYRLINTPEEAPGDE